MNADIIFNKIKEIDNPKIRISFSGGKDSLALLFWCKENFKKHNLKFDIWCASNFLEWNDIKIYIKYLEKKLKLNINIMELNKNELKKIEKYILHYAETLGLPLFFRYCQYSKKLIFDKINKLNYNIILEGIRWNESTGRGKSVLFHKRKDGILTIRPLLNWSDKKVYEIIKENKIKLHWIYQYTDRLGCALCAISFLKKNPIQKYIGYIFKDEYNLSFYKKWYNKIENVGWKNLGSDKKLIKKYYQFVNNWKEFKVNIKNKNIIKLKKRDIPNYGFWKQ